VRDRVDEGDDVAAHAVADALAGRACQHLQGFGFDGFDVSLQGFSSSAAIDAAGHMPHFVGCSGDDAANGRDTR
jgi:2C-methyl-D-erythritol 2,4-cyclodiphosphate synthase